MAAQANITRRMALSTLSALPLIAALPAPVAASTIMATFAQWEALYDAAFLRDLDDEDEIDRLCDEMKALEIGVKDASATTPSELLAIMLMKTLYGTFTVSDDFFLTPNSLRLKSQAVLKVV